MKKAILILFTILLSKFTQAQLFDNYSLKLGLGFSNLHWEYKNDNLSDHNNWKDDKLGFNFFLNAEKKLTSLISIRPEIGYIQKGFKENVIYSKTINDLAENLKTNVTLHNVSGDIGIKFTPIEHYIKPYFITGLRGSYMIGYKDFEIESEGNLIGAYKSTIEDFNKFNLSGLIGLGIQFKEVFYLEFEYNPTISKNLNDPLKSIKERYYGLSIGLYFK